ncbi:MAG: hypothetical protein JRK53_06780 [Deltaproteobacteria bacterium]|nr:hypothetical protein [Deltaproteobacteria bacterium]MBW1816265.1 hypothetical protein [Deltaproteobacteria bacterium]
MDFDKPESRGLEPVPTDFSPVLKTLDGLPGREIVNRILESENPTAVVHGLPPQDFFWLVKQVGDDDCLPVLQLASTDQWRYLLDMELWLKDRMDVAKSSLWLGRLEQADRKRLVKWLFSDGQALAYFHLFHITEVIVIENQEELLDLPDGFFSLDEIFYIRVLDPDHRETVERMLREMADESLERYQALLLGLSGVLPAEMEEQMYRVRNVRLAEQGFLPYDEALSVYAPLDPEDLQVENGDENKTVLLTEESRLMAPASPLAHAGTRNLLTDVVSRISHPLFLDRIRLEFAGLCNQIFSAEGTPAPELAILVKISNRAAGYVNLAIERLCGHDIAAAERLLRRHSLVTLFRVGVGIPLKLGWEAERWVRGSWFMGQGRDTDFWGEAWGGTLLGLLQKRPRLHTRMDEDEPFKDFEWLSEVGACLTTLRRLMVLDGLLEQLASRFRIDVRTAGSSEIAFHQLLFNLWARLSLDMAPSFSGISIARAQRLFARIRGERAEPPYGMPGVEKQFVDLFLSYAAASDAEATAVLKETLELLWGEFVVEYERISLDDLSEKFSLYITIETTDSEND